MGEGQPQEAGDICILMANLHCCTETESNTMLCKASLSRIKITEK